MNNNEGIYVLVAVSNDSLKMITKYYGQYNGDIDDEFYICGEEHYMQQLVDELNSGKYDSSMYDFDTSLPNNSHYALLEFKKWGIIYD